MTALHLSRVVLRPPTPQMRLILMTDVGRSDPISFAHKLVWRLFAEQNANRNFLYRVEGFRPFTALIRSRRPPADRDACWEIHTIPFNPPLEAGQRLSFALDAAAVTNEPQPGRRGKRWDVVLHAYKALPPERQAVLPLAEFAERVALEWLQRQGERHGFTFQEDEVAFRGYFRHRVGGAQRKIRFGSVGFAGHLIVTDSDVFRRMLADGLGAEKAFGFGMMLIGPPRRPLMPTPAGG